MNAVPITLLPSERSPNRPCHAGQEDWIHFGFRFDSLGGHRWTNLEAYRLYWSILTHRLVKTHATGQNARCWSKRMHRWTDLEAYRLYWSK